MSRLRILALHGYHGSAELLRAQMRGLANAIEPVADVIYIDAPALADGDFGWWHAVADAGAPPSAVRPMRYRGWSRTRDRILSLCANDGPFDGVLGFSQGAVLAALLIAMGTCDVEHPRHGLDFAIMIGGFRSNDPRHAQLYDAPGGVAAPTLHIIGRHDTIVSSNASHALASRFLAPVIVEHDGGHVIASAPEVRASVRRFVDDMARRARDGNGKPTASAPPSFAHSPAATTTALPSRSRMSTPSPPVLPTPSTPLELPLWPDRARHPQLAHPIMRIHVPDADRAHARPALVVLRGGGYSRNDGSGAGSASWAARHGMIAVEVEYSTRATRSVHPAAYSDAARAVRLVRYHAHDWGIDPTRVGVLGFSAGGHLATLLSTQPALVMSPEDDLAGTLSARPDLVVLAYPLISFVDGYAPGAFASSVENLFGKGDVDEATRRQVSSELHVAADHPPVFLWTTADDAIVPASHSQLFADACRRAGVPVAFTLYPHGPHGMGLALGQPGDVGQWTTQLLTWLARQWGPASEANPAIAVP